MRAPVLLLLCSTLAACSDSVDLPPMEPYVPPSAPTELVVSNGIKLAVAEAKFANPIVRGVSNDSRTGIYAVFFNEKAYAGLRLPAILEGCEHQNYHPFIPVAAPQKSAPAKLTGKTRT